MPDKTTVGKRGTGKTARSSGGKETTSTSTPTDPNGPTDQQYAAVGAFLEERDVMMEVFVNCLDLMSHLETFWQSSRENGERSPQTVIALGKLFTKVNEIHRGHLRKRILEVREKLDKSERRYMKALEPK
jgi:hypothetical protein